MSAWFSRALFLLLSVCACVALGCGSSDGTYRVSGTVNFQGKPVPAGTVYFSPDGNKGNSGPTGFAVIRDGSYDTAATGGRGAKAGAVIIAVEGIDPAGPGKADPTGEITTKALFPRYELAAELPASASTKDIDVPADAAKKPVGVPEKKIIIP